MKYQKGFVTPALIIIGVLVLGGLAYYTFKTYPGRNATTTPAAALTANSGQITSAGITTNGQTNVGTTPTQPEASKPTEAAAPEPHNSPAGDSGDALVEVSQAGTLAQRLGLTTLTDVDYSYALSYPGGWTSSGPSNAVIFTNGRSSIVITSVDVATGTTAEALAAQNGIVGGFITTSVNAYRALENAGGGTTSYFIVNGSVGYRITVTDLGDSSVIHTILLTFTVTKQR